jgi:hypothetical protein
VQKRWPLHPKPHDAETLEHYVRRLAECYGVRYELFCLRALGIPVADSRARQFQAPTPELLQRLSTGTGISVELLEQMTWRRVWDRLMDKVRQYVETAEGKAALELVANRRLVGNPPHK